MFHEFLLEERENILALCKEKVLRLSDSRSSSPEMELGLPVFYDELIEVLQADEATLAKGLENVSRGILRDSAGRRGKESLKLGYTISQVVFGYGALCQAITEYAGKCIDQTIEPREFNRLNLCLDVAVAEAVTEFTRSQQVVTANEEVERLGALAHEMRNTLARAIAAHRMIIRGVVGIAGSTNKVLEDALTRMKNIIDRSLSEVRLRIEPEMDRQQSRVIDLVGEVEATSMSEASQKSLTMHIQVPPELVVSVDRHLMVSAISNLVENAINLTNPNGNIWIRGKAVGDLVLLEVEDECGGLSPEKIEALFQPDTQKHANKSGVGPGLSIAKRAITRNGGQISVHDVPGKGCVFTVTLQRVPALQGKTEEEVFALH